MPVHLGRLERVAVLTLDNPPVNALSTRVYAELEARIAALEADEDVRVVVLAAGGTRAFSAGADIREFERFFAPGEGYNMAVRILRLLSRLEALPKITIAAIDAPALGGGCELILACDLRVASTTAMLGFPEVRVGQFPGTGGTLRLPWLIGEARAREMLITGESIGAERALEIGLVHRVVEPGAALGYSIDWARELASRPAPGIAAIKRSILANRAGDTEAASIADAELSEWVFQSAEAREGYRAFIEKRSPRFG